MKHKKHFTKDDAVFFVLIAIISVSFSYYTKGINEAVSYLRGEEQVAQVNTVAPKEPTTSKTKLLSPNGQEQWIAGETRTIRWEGISNIPVQNQVEILLFPWSAKGDLVEAQATAIIATSTQNTGSFQWKIPSTIPAGDYFVRVFCISFQNCLGSRGDDSDASFRISRAGINLISPNGGEKVLQNTPLSIRWYSSEENKQGVDIRLIGYIPGSDKIVGTTSVLALSLKNKGTFTWDVPSGLSAEYTYYISVSASKGGGYEDRNDKPFSIVSNTQTLVAYCAGDPQGQTMRWRGTVSGGTAPYRYTWSGNEGLAGTTQTLEWHYENAIGTKNATLTVTSRDGQEAKTTCSAALVVRGK